MRRTVPQALQCTASGSWRSSAQVGHSKSTFDGRNSAWARRKKSVTPQIMMATDSSRPVVPGSVMSPKPVVVSVVTVK
jgi:hypothetical protein